MQSSIEHSRVFREISEHKDKRVPLTGEYNKAVLLFNVANPEMEARDVYQRQGPTFVQLSASLVPPGVEDLEMAKNLLEEKINRFLVIPQTGDLITKENRQYLEAASEYAFRFNTTMLKQNYCSRTYGNDAQIDWVTGSKSLNNGTKVAHFLRGFTCAYSVKNKESGCVDGAILEKSEGSYICRSKIYEMKTLCPNKEINRYWQGGEEAYEEFCK